MDQNGLPSGVSRGLFYLNPRNDEICRGPGSYAPGVGRGPGPDHPGDGRNPDSRKWKRRPAFFGCASGRSGFILRGYLMRLMHLGFTVYFVGETTTPRIRPGDLLVVMSGSGETAFPREMQRRANGAGARTLAVTAHADSTIGREAQVVITIPGTTKLTRTQEAASVQCPGSLFEQATFLFLEAVVLILYQRRAGRDQSEVLERHADLE